MCLIAVKDKNKKLPDKTYLYNGYQNNPNGVGIAILKKGNPFIHIKKDFKNFEEFWLYISKNVKEEDLLIIHFRLATAGLVDIGNRHPFPITKNINLLRKSELYSRYAMVHNGVINKYSYHKKLSDSQKFIMDILTGVKHKLGYKPIKKLIGGFLNGDKLAIIANGELILIGKFTEDKGILWSNEGYKAVYRISTSKYENKFEGYLDINGKSWCELCLEYKALKYVSKLDGYLCRKCRKDVEKNKDYWNGLPYVSPKK
jgi:predicted glutamine amidotransferase